MTKVGQPVPACGSSGAVVGALVGAVVATWQVQSVSAVQAVFRHVPAEQISPLAQSALTLQVLLHEAGVGLGEAVAVGLAVGEAVPVPVGVAVAAEMAKDKGEQISAVCARGALEGTLGATGCCLS